MDKPEEKCTGEDHHHHPVRRGASRSWWRLTPPPATAVSRNGLDVAALASQLVQLLVPSPLHLSWSPAPLDLLYKLIS